MSSFIALFQNAVGLSHGRIMRRMAGCLVLAILTGCAASPQIDLDQGARLKRVGVLALLPEDIRFEKIGITVFNNEEASRPLGPMLNRTAQAAARRALEAPGREVIALDADLPTLAKRVRSSLMYWDSPADAISKDVELLVRQHHLDAVVIVMEMFDLDRGNKGVRVFLRQRLSVEPYATLMPDVGVVLVDSQVKKIGSGTSPVQRVAVPRSGGRAWVNRLEENLDEATVDEIVSTIRKTIDTVVHANVKTLGM